MTHYTCVVVYDREGNMTRASLVGYVTADVLAQVVANVVADVRGHLM